MEHLFPYPKMGHSFLEILHDPLTRRITGYHLDQGAHGSPCDFVRGVQWRLSDLAADATKHLSLLKIGYSSLEAFLQSNCTGPPLDFDSREVVIPPDLMPQAQELQRQIFAELEVDGNAAYALTPHIELFWLAKICMSHNDIAEAGFNGRRARFRVTFMHQKLLLEKSEALKDQLYNDADILEHQLASRLAFHGAAAEEHFVEFLLERAAIRTYYGDDESAQEDLLLAAKTRKFQFALTGALGKRTKFQDRDLSQLVVLARSRDHEPEPYNSRKSSRAEGMESRKNSEAEQASKGSVRHMSPVSLLHHQYKPENVPLNDDTLLEAIHFKQHPSSENDLTNVADTSELTVRLAGLDPAAQPLLFPLDSIILLGTASSISNTSPADGLTREETLPYATRVLEGGSSNWQVYTQALLVRSRIEGYRSRTAERGLLQLQALVDQVIAETTPVSRPAGDQKTTGGPETDVHPTTFLPKAAPSESATVAERLKYIYQLAPPLRWELESELAARWVHVGGLKTALDIYERLQMHAEVALCLAATDREAEAIQTIRMLLFEESHASDSTSQSNGLDAARSAGVAESPKLNDAQHARPRLVSTSHENQHASAVSVTTQTSYPNERNPLPPDAPRLFCILGDLESNPSHYHRAWSISHSRYARAQRSLGRYHGTRREYPEAAIAYEKALEVSRLNASTWFALGCVQLEMEEWAGAVESFTRTVRERDEDGEAWSNLAVALLRLPEEGDDDPKDAAMEHLNLADERIDGDEEEDGVMEEDVLEEAKEEEDDVNMAQHESQSSQTSQPQQTSTSVVPPSSTAFPSRYRHLLSALSALRHAARLKPTDARIWDNYLTVSASLPPPHTPWKEIILAQRKVIELRGQTVGEKCVDEDILGVCVAYVVETYDYPDGDEDEDEEATKGTMRRLGIPRSLCELIDIHVVPLITSSPALWLLVAKLQRWRRRPMASLSAQEKAWRVVTSQPGVYEKDRKSWEGVVDATLGLVVAYEELGGLERERTGGRVVEGDAGWRFKARSAVRGVMGKGRGTWEGSEGWVRLEEEMVRLKSLSSD